MEKKESLESGDLVKVLIEGRDLTKQLQLMILSNEPPRSYNHNDNNHNDKVYELAQNILAKFERSLQILQYDPTINQSNKSFSGSPKSQDDYHNNGDFLHPFDLKNDPKRLRRIIPQLTQRVQGCTKNGLEGPIEDGFNWRKYGQKDILGSRYPRAYFRCNQRSIKGCYATKLVQRSEEDPAFFQVIYRGEHTCSKASSIPNNLTQKPESSIEIIACPPCQKSKKETMLILKNDIDSSSSSSTVVHDACFQRSSFSFPSSSSNPLVQTQQIHHPTTLLMPNYNTNYVSDHHSLSSSTFQSPSSSVANNINFNQQTSSSSSAPPLWFDLGEFELDFFIDNPHYTK